MMHKQRLLLLRMNLLQLRKSLTAEKETILKAQEESTIKLPNMDELAEMDWSDIHKMVGEFKMSGYINTIADLEAQTYGINWAYWYR